MYNRTVCLVSAFGNGHFSCAPTRTVHLLLSTIFTPRVERTFVQDAVHTTERYFLQGKLWFQTENNLV